MQQQPYDPAITAAFIHDRRPPKTINWAMTGAYFIASLGLGIAVAVAVLFLGYRSTAGTQLAQLRHEVSDARSQAQAVSGKDASTIRGLSGRVGTLENAMGTLGQFSMVCSQDLTGASGPAQFWFMCSDTKPGG